MKILVLGATGLLGNAVFRSLSKASGAHVEGTIRLETARRLFAPEFAGRLIVVRDLAETGLLARLLDHVRPDVVINCVAVGRPAPPDPMRSILIHSLLPRRLFHYCSLSGARLIQISTDGVFSGSRGAYTEDDVPDANDVYGIS